MDKKTAFEIGVAFSQGMQGVAMDARWITVKPNGEDETGRHVKIDDSGKIVAGIGKENKGKTISQVKRENRAQAAAKPKKAVISAETRLDTPQRQIKAFKALNAEMDKTSNGRYDNIAPYGWAITRFRLDNEGNIKSNYSYKRVSDREHHLENLVSRIGVDPKNAAYSISINPEFKKNPPTVAELRTAIAKMQKEKAKRIAEYKALEEKAKPFAEKRAEREKTEAAEAEQRRQERLERFATSEKMHEELKQVKLPKGFTRIHGNQHEWGLHTMNRGYIVGTKGHYAVMPMPPIRSEVTHKGWLVGVRDSWLEKHPEFKKYITKD